MALSTLTHEQIAAWRTAYRARARAAEEEAAIISRTLRRLVVPNSFAVERGRALDEMRMRADARSHCPLCVEGCCPEHEGC